MSTATHHTFSEIVGQFLDQRCMTDGADLHVSCERLFPQFRAFWTATTHGAHYPALLGQFRVEMTERGYQSTGGKRPIWYGLTLRPTR
jgi:hypothetical protein